MPLSESGKPELMKLDSSGYSGISTPRSATSAISRRISTSRSSVSDS